MTKACVIQNDKRTTSDEERNVSIATCTNWKDWIGASKSTRSKCHQIHCYQPFLPSQWPNPKHIHHVSYCVGGETVHNILSFNFALTRRHVPRKKNLLLLHNHCSKHTKGGFLYIQWQMDSVWFHVSAQVPSLSLHHQSRARNVGITIQWNCCMIKRRSSIELNNHVIISKQSCRSNVPFRVKNILCRHCKHRFRKRFIFGTAPNHIVKNDKSYSIILINGNMAVRIADLSAQRWCRHQ